jgi:hypothetical protein
MSGTSILDLVTRIGTYLRQIKFKLIALNLQVVLNIIGAKLV